jgi:predicted Zn-dependent peptidase
LPEPATVHTFANGLTLLIEPVAGVRSAAMTLWTPCGVAGDPADARGVASVVAEMTMRGAGRRGSRQLSDDLDRLGIQRESSAGLFHTRYQAAATAARLLEAVPIYADIVRRPMMEPDAFEPARQLSVQELTGLDDDPRSMALIELRKHHWPDPLGRNTTGELNDLELLTYDRCVTEYQRRYTPRGTLIGIAGDIDSAQVIDLVAEHFADWQGPEVAVLMTRDEPTPAGFVKQDSEQTHIGIACPYVAEAHEDYYVARVAADVLSGGSGGRLFTEIREVKGLCYSVGTSYAPLRDRASLLGYAGTSNDRAQATLDAFISEMDKFRLGVTLEEVERAKIGLMSGTVMSGESTRSRAHSIVADYFTRGRVRSLAEIVTAVDAVTHEAVDAFVKRRPLGPFTIVIVGPTDLSLSFTADRVA